MSSDQARAGKPTNRFVAHFDEEGVTVDFEPLPEYLTPECRCHDCRDSDEAGCAVIMHGPDGERVQCGLQGRHDGSCDYWEKPHDER